GLHQLTVDTSNAAFTAGKIYDFFISAGDLGANTAVGIHVGHFELIPEPADLRMVNGGSTGATAGILELAQLKIVTTGSVGAAVQIDGTVGGNTGVEIEGDYALYIHNDTGANGVVLIKAKDVTDSGDTDNAVEIAGKTQIHANADED